MCEPWRFLLFGSFDPLIAWVFQASHRGSFSNSSVGTLRLLTATGIPDVCGDFSERGSRRNQRVCHRQPSGFSDGAMSGTARRMPENPIWEGLRAILKASLERQRS
jgi:hypothetical protein